MSKKSVAVICIIVLLIFVVSMLIACIGFKPTVTLNYSYPNFDWSFITKETNTDWDSYIKEYSSVIRFSHYQPPIPTRDGYTFAGWYKDIGYTVAWINGQDTVTRDITLYAKWVKST